MEEMLRADETLAIDVRPDAGALPVAETPCCGWNSEADAEVRVPLARIIDPVAALAEVAELVSKSHSPISSWAMDWGKDRKPQTTVHMRNLIFAEGIGPVETVSARY